MPTSGPSPVLREKVPARADEGDSILYLVLPQDAGEGPLVGIYATTPLQSG